MCFPGGSEGKESACNVGDLGSIPAWEDPWRKAWQPTQVFLPGEFPRTEEPGRLHIVHGVAKSQSQLSNQAQQSIAFFI